VDEIFSQTIDGLPIDEYRKRQAETNRFYKALLDNLIRESSMKKTTKKPTKVKKPLKRARPVRYEPIGCMEGGLWSAEPLDNPCTPAETLAKPSLWHAPHAVDTPGLYVARLDTGEFQALRLVITLSSATQQRRRWCLTQDAKPPFEINEQTYAMLVSVFGPIDEV
jgi:hypothetical protein